MIETTAAPKKVNNLTPLRAPRAEELPHVYRHVLVNCNSSQSLAEGEVILACPAFPDKPKKQIISATFAISARDHLCALRASAVKYPLSKTPTSLINSLHSPGTCSIKTRTLQPGNRF